MTDKLKGLIFYSKNIKDNDLFIKILSSKDEVNQGIVYGGNSSKKKLIYQKGYFIDYSIKKKKRKFSTCNIC
jgi:recombinational DNA repair protein (RecF pathway)